MEVTTIVGIALAVIIMALGLRMIFKKSNHAMPSLDSELQVNEDSQKPIIPRHVRDQLQSTAEEVTDKVEPTLDTHNIQSETNLDAEVKPTEVVEKTPNVKASENNAEAKETEHVETTKQETTTPVKEAEVFALNSQIKKAEISEFDEESGILDAHLYEQKVADEECELSNAESLIALHIYPQGRVLSGDKTLKVLLKYGLRFGELACFHRYSDDGSHLLFSVLQITDTKMDGFDLETLSTEEVKGLAFFLALPHADVQNAFDTMDSIARLIAREIDGVVFDQNNQELTPQLRDFWRHQAIDYRIGQPLEV